MTEWQAWQEARNRWGPEAFVEETMAGFYVRSHEGWNTASQSGWGFSWEEAFADADRRSPEI
jgi:hypothetical protein